MKAIPLNDFRPRDTSRQQSVSPDGQDILRLGEFYVCELRRFSLVSPRFRTMCRLCRHTASREMLEDRKGVLEETLDSYCWERYRQAQERTNRRQQVLGNAWKRYQERRQLVTEGSLTLEEWIAICRSYGGHCAYCGSVCSLTIDHVIPLSKGGQHAAANVVPACMPCNARKKDQIILQGQQFVLDLHGKILPLYNS